MAWRLANSLTTLRNQVNAAYPNRNKASDDTIGDAAHAAVASDHNPNPQEVVCALDLTNHPGYFDAHALADRLIANRHPNLKYIISNRRIAGSHNGWRWQAYNGSNPHTAHIHVSVGVGPDGKSAAGTYDNVTQWNIKGSSGGGSMADKTSLATARIFAECILGRDRTQTHKGAYDADLKKHHVNGPLSNGYVETLWNSPEAKNAATRRANDAKNAALVPGLKVEIGKLKARIKELEGSAGNVPPGTYLKIGKDDIVEAK